MAESIRYHEVKPNNSKDTYNEFDNVSWDLVADGRKLLKNSIRVEGDLEIFQTGTTRKAKTDDIRVSHLIGAHAFWESWTSETSVGQLEVLQSYPRYVNHVASSSLDSEDLCNAHFIAELRNPAPAGASASIEQQVSYNDNATNTVQSVDASFSISPMLCFNRMSGDYSFSKHGGIRISANLARATHALYGRNVAGDTSYGIKNLVLKFTSVPDDGSNERLMMESYVPIKTSVNSTDFNVSSRIPSRAVNGVSISFLDQSHESDDRLIDTYRLENFENIEEVSYLFNNSLGKYITYKLDDKADIIKKGLEAMYDAGHHQANGLKLKGNQAFMAGTNFSEYLDLSNNKFTFNIKTSNALISTNPKICFLYFHQLLSL
tara:strand:- start:73 stop:1200 length:1128 start_codon:yes stop_codon:yes gene_type:complete